MEKRVIQITIETATRWYNGNDQELKSLAVQTYPELEKPKWATKWADLDNADGYFVGYLSNIGRATSETIDSAKCHFPIIEQAKAVLALSQLLQLRHQMVGNWYPGKKEPHFCILFYGDDLIFEDYTAVTRPLSFQNEEQAEWFIKYHSELINQARILI